MAKQFLCLFLLVAAATAASLSEVQPGDFVESEVDGEKVVFNLDEMEADWDIDEETLQRLLGIDGHIDMPSGVNTVSIKVDGDRVEVQPPDASIKLGRV